MKSISGPNSNVVSAVVGAIVGALSVCLYQKIMLRGKETDRNLNERHPAPRRFGAAIKLRPEQYKAYRQLHDKVWEKVLERIYLSNIRNFKIFFHPETSTMFQSFEWIGHWKATDVVDEAELFQADMQAIADDPVTREWWKLCEPCQEPFSQWSSPVPPSSGGSGDWWAPLECLCETGHWPTAYSAQRHDPDFVKMKK